MLRIAAVTLFLSLVPGLALAGMCPALMTEIDTALTTAEVSDEVRTQITELRTKGEELHNTGDHAGSVAALNEARALLGL